MCADRRYRPNHPSQTIRDRHQTTMTTNTTLHAGHDVRYLTSGNAHGGNAGAMRYYTASGEPPGWWAGKGAAALGLSGTVDGTVMDRLYMENVGPAGERL